MANQYSVLWYGSTCEFDEMRLRREGYEREWALTYNGGSPPDIGVDGRENGWVVRRAIKAWCVKHDITDYRIRPNRGWARDLRGDRVYELWLPKSKSSGGA